MRLRLAVAGVVGLFGNSIPQLQAQGCTPPPFALVLSGGGAKGLAHIGVIEVLDSLGLRPSLVVGTSMGSIVGALYSSGYHGHAIDSLARALLIQDVFRRDLPRGPRAIGAEQPLLMWEQGKGRFEFRQPAVQEVALNSKLNAALLRGNLMARGDFDSLAIPFRAVATDLTNRKAVVLRSGDLAHAVRASMSIPLVFHPQTIDSVVLGDGGLVANIPVGAARSEGAKRLVISDVGWHEGDSVNLASPLVLIDQLVGFLFSQETDSLHAQDRLIVPEVQEFAVLDFSETKMDSLITLGYQAAAKALDGMGCDSPEPPAQAASLRQFKLARVATENATPVEKAALEKRLGLSEGARVSVYDLRRGLQDLSNLDNFEEVWLNPSGHEDSLSLNLVIRPAPPRLAALGIDYDSDIGGRAWVGLLDRGATIPGVEGSAVVNLDELRQGVTAALRPAVVGNRLVRPVFSAKIWGESVRLYDSTGVLQASVRDREARGFLGLEHEFGSRGVLGLGGTGYVGDADVPEPSGVGLEMYFNSGPRYRPSGAFGEFTWTSGYTRLHLEAKQRFKVGALNLIPEMQYGIGDALPPHLTLMLGGYEGFPGFHIGERRDECVLMFRLTAYEKLIGPFSLRLQGAAGQVSEPDGGLPQGNWLGGARIGLGLDTPIGDVRVEYGRNTEDRDQFFVRIGQRY
ncbi:MAG TPA: patatin-like phospholipase family protein [Gemmatimonadales bacterium]|nr:patatin-like phospholipase family protein [Gemmatimonadales bacterium]